MLVRSRSGYGGSSKRYIDTNDIFDVESDGEIVGQITGKQLISHLRYCKRNGRPPKYTNVDVNSRIVYDPDYKPKKILFAFGVNVDSPGKAQSWIRETELVTCTESVHDELHDYAFEFANGFVIGVHQFLFQYYGSEYGHVSFKLFGSEKVCGLGTSFGLVFTIMEYEPDLIRGYVTAAESFPDAQFDYSKTKLGDFELRRDGTVYNGKPTAVVYDKAHYAKELLLNG